jgi:hypothetical protein
MQAFRGISQTIQQSTKRNIQIFSLSKRVNDSVVLVPLDKFEYQPDYEDDVVDPNLKEDVKFSSESHESDLENS